MWFKKKKKNFDNWNSLSSQKGSISITRAEINFSGFGKANRRVWQNDVKMGRKAAPFLVVCDAGYDVIPWSSPRRRTRFCSISMGDIRSLVGALPMWCWFIGFILRILCLFQIVNLIPPCISFRQKIYEILLSGQNEFKC